MKELKPASAKVMVENGVTYIEVELTPEHREQLAGTQTTQFSIAAPKPPVPEETIEFQPGVGFVIEEVPVAAETQP